MNTRRKISRNQSNRNEWWYRYGPFGGGGNGPEAVKNIRKLAYTVIIPTACIIALIKIGRHSGELWISSLFDGKRGCVNPDNPQSPSPIDEEKVAKEKDLSVKNRICKLLGLFNPESPQPTPLNANPDDGNTSIKPKPLVGTLFKSGDRAVVVSLTGIGKSIFSWQTGIAVSEGKSPEYLPQFSEHAAPQKVFIYDGELDMDDIKQRYGQRVFSDLLVRYPNCKFRTIYYLLTHIYENVESLDGDATIILDNLYALMPTMTSEETRTFLDGLDIIQRRAMDRGNRITLILVTHTVKDVNGIPRLKDVAGSAHISRFAKSELSLVALPDAPNRVAVVTNKKRYSNHKDAYLMEYKDDDYLHFEYVDKVSNAYIDSVFHRGGRSGVAYVDKTPEHTTTGERGADLIQQMRDLRNQGYSDRQISAMTGVSAPTVAKRISSNGNGHHNGGRGAHRHHPKP